MKTITESQVRALRDQVYGRPISDSEWAKCKDKWMADVDWLKEMAAKAKAGEAFPS